MTTIAATSTTPRHPPPRVHRHASGQPRPIRRTIRIAAPSPALARRFDELAAKWRDDTKFHSSPKILFEHPAYQEIIAFGPAVLPLLFKDLEETGSFWFWALKAITNENSVPHADRGDIPRVAEHWLNWGRERGYVNG